MDTERSSSVIVCFGYIIIFITEAKKKQLEELEDGILEDGGGEQELWRER